MKILCVSDQIDPLVYNNAAKERFSDIDMVLCAGDLPMEYIDFIVSVINKPTYFIFGNHNLNDFHYYHKSAGLHASSVPYSPGFDCSHSHGAMYAGFRTLREGSVLIAGASGSIRYNNGLNQYTDRQMYFKLLKLIPALLLNKLRYGRYLDIFLTHAPPENIQDLSDPCHRGFRCYRWFIRKFSPAYLIHGHIHLYDMQATRMTRYLDTTVINAYSHYILETGFPRTKKETRAQKRRNHEHT